MSTKQVEVNEKMKKQKQVKQKIEQIMQSVKQEKQFIENKLATNDQKIRLYSEQYETLKQLNDFSQLKEGEEMLLDEITKGLEENGIDPRKIIGGQQMGVKKWDNYDSQTQELKSLTNQQIIAVQTMLIDKLAIQLKQKQNK